MKADQDRLPPRMMKNIGLWGTPSGGKTTFLAALYISASRSARDLRIFGTADESAHFVLDSVRTLSSDHRFPGTTMQASSYNWIMNMSREVQVRTRRRFGWPKTVTSVVHSQFSIHLLEPSGVSPPDEMMDCLAGCEGLLLLIDPVREQELGDAYGYFQASLLRVAQRRLASMPPGSRLPHYVAICITKFDDPRVYDFARLNGYRTYDENDLFPRVHDDDAESFLKEFCRVSAASDAEMLCNILGQFFWPERIRYFVTSAVGFYSRRDRFHDDDWLNVVERDDGTMMIRGQIHPINVLEPVLWLGQSVTTLS